MAQCTFVYGEGGDCSTGGGLGNFVNYKLEGTWTTGTVSACGHSWTGFFLNGVVHPDPNFILNPATVVVTYGDCDESIPPPSIGTNAGNPIVARPSNSTPTYNANTQEVIPPKNGTTGKSNGYLQYKPQKSLYAGTEFSRNFDVYVGQNIKIREILYLDFTILTFQIEYAYLNRPLPWAHGGWIQLQYNDKDSLLQILEEEEIRINLLTPNTYRAILVREYEEYLLPAKGDFKSATIQELDGCNLSLQPNPSTLVLVEGVGTAPIYTLASPQPTLVGLNQIGVIDLDSWEYATKFDPIGIYIDPGWELKKITHEMRFIDFAVRAPTEQQLKNPYTCLNS